MRLLALSFLVIILTASTVYSKGTGFTEQTGNTTTSSTNGRDTETAVVDVTNPATGRVWMDRNLGASRAATSSTDEEAYGDLYQWGRAADGHQKRDSDTTFTLSSTDQPGHGSFIIVRSEPNFWRNPENDNLWQGVNGINNPCPPGFRLPTDAELLAERNSWSSNDAAGAYASPLKLPMAGVRSHGMGIIRGVGQQHVYDYMGYYWSSTVDGCDARSLNLMPERVQPNGITREGSAGMGGNSRAFGGSVRCIKD